MFPAMIKALEGKTDSQLLDIILLAMIDNDDSLLNRLSGGSSQHHVNVETNTANAELLKAIVSHIRNRAMVETETMKEA
jgi:hypothetical protein